MNQSEANKIFNSVSKAVSTSDYERLDDLMKEPDLEDEKQDDAPEVVEDEVVEDGDKTPEDDSDKEEDKDSTEDDNEDGDKSADEADDADEKVEDDKEDDEVKALKEQLEQLKKDNHNLKSQAGRVPHVQKRLRELDKKLEELSKASPSSQTSEKVNAKVGELLAGIKKTDPELADAIAAAITAATTGIVEEAHAGNVDTVRTLRDSEASSAMEYERDRLLTMYPNAPEVFKSTHWSDWKKSQPEGIVALAESGNADEVAHAFRLYADDMATKYPQIAEQKQAPADKTNNEAAAKAQKIEADRQRSKTKSANLGSPSAPAKVSIPDDPEALFKRYTAQFEKEMKG